MAPAGHRDNNFDALRLLAAGFVIYGHGSVLAFQFSPGLLGVSVGRVGLDVFFAISGYMVTGSWMRSPELGGFLARRALRVFPGLIACVLFTTFILGARLSSLPLAEYLAHPGTLAYLKNIALYATLYLPGVFYGLPAGGAVNGSLWSLGPEVALYLTVPVLAMLPWLPRLVVLALGGAAAGGFGIWLFNYPWGNGLVVYGFDARYALVEVPFFFMGAFYQLVSRNRAGFFRADFALLGMALNWWLSSWYGDWTPPLAWFTLPYVVLCFGRGSMPVIRRAGRFGDFSYGMYLYAFPVQQVILGALPGFQYPIMLCALATLPFAVLSWHVVEAPAMRWRPRVAGRESTIPTS